MRLPPPKRVRRSWPALLTATTMLTAVSSAFAQEAVQQASVEDDEANTVEEVIVTAQKRTENLQDVPVSIQALGTERLDELQVTDFQDYVKYLPSVSFQTFGPGFTSINMRGVASGENVNHSASLPTVGVYVDEQPVTTITGPLEIHVYDVARVEALSGPQGTLYGASSLAGTIRIITNKPDPSGFEAGYDLEASAVDHGGLGGVAEGFANLPINDRLTLRVVGWAEHQAGYIDNVRGTRTYPTAGITIDNDERAEDDYNEVDTLGARAALRIDLDETWTATPTLMVQDQKSEGSFAYDPDVGDLELVKFYPESAHDRWAQAALTIEGKIGAFDMVYAGAYLKRDIDSESDYSDYSFFYDTLYEYAWYADDGVTPINPSQYIQAKDRFLKESHELRLSSPGEERLRAVGGLFFQRQTHRIEQLYEINGLGQQFEVTGWPDTIWLTQQRRIDRDYALFGEASLDLTEKLTFTAGARAFRAKNSLIGFFGFGEGYSGSTGEAACFGPPIVEGGPCTNLNKTVTEEGFTHKLNLTYDIDDDRMVYVTYSTGFRPGGINRRGTLPPYLSDFLINHEFGWKTSWLDRRLRWNGAVYYDRWEDFQFSILGANGLTEIKNAGQAEIFGVESDINYRVTEGLTLTASAAYTDAQLTENYCGFTDDQGNPVTDCADPLAPTGTALPITPKFKGNLTARYEFPLGGFDAHLQGSLVHQSSAWTDLRLAEREILGKQKAYTVADFAFGVERSNWSVEAYLQNAFDERAQLYRFAQCAEAVCGGTTYIVPNQPRTVGLRFGQKF